ncbi:SUMF1/EgtB/PvdO family nonheme iron enzyme [Sorangium sp. So ce1504]|uniref:SUMF1/EgtB/PvdO family nonheme iron enzyme n=1 Tax=Sorangium sp. So ce1504 TaxID=3133337 RepID=UPI003F5F1F63
MSKLRARYARAGVAVAAMFGCSAALLGCNSVLGIEDFDVAGCPSASARRCLDSNTPQVCGPNGTWESQPDCVEQVCDNASGTCVGECAPPATQCAGDVPQVCSNAGRWESRQRCDNQTCSKELGACIGVCAPAQKHCQGNTLQHCDANGQWEDERSCSDERTCNATDADGCVGECKAGLKQCTDDNALQECGTDGQWRDPKPCGEKTCSEELGACIGICAPTQKHCQGNTLQHCDANGQWEDERSCSDERTCNAADADGCVGECKAGLKQCTDDNALQECGMDGQWQPPHPCGEQTCSKELGLCIGICAPTQKHCQRNTLQHCDANGQWEDERSCSDERQTCDDADADGCVGACAPEQKRCAGGVPQQCEKGAWATLPACGGPTHCYGGDCVVSCAPGSDVWCFGNTPHMCNISGNWAAGTTCESKTCIEGVCEGECALRDARCSGNTPQTCDERGRWKDRTECESSCEAGSCPGRSCEGLPLNCGPERNESCCLSPVVLGGRYHRFDDRNHPATVSDFRLDRFEVTVGRFRKFVEMYPASRPAAGAGAHPLIEGSGWPMDWDAELPADRETLEAQLASCMRPTWSMGSENRPMNCLTWYTAFAFCAWDGGRLPTEAEWNYAAAGGGEQRTYPWSTPPSSTTLDSSHALYNCDGWTSCQYFSIENVGSKSPHGDGKWGQSDLAGSMWEWNLDIFSDYLAEIECNDCAYLGFGTDRGLLGGSWNTSGSPLRSSTRSHGNPRNRNVEGNFGSNVGVRCARTP